MYIYEELHKFSEIGNLNVCDNLVDHMIGNVYVQFREEDEATGAHIGPFLLWPTNCC
jgi:splicing factor U2AF 35 kDa subunit